MRVLCIVLFSASSGCSLLDSTVAGGGTGTGATLGYDPSKVYLGKSVVMINPRDTDRYGCFGGPMSCENFGSRMECRCLE